MGEKVTELFAGTSDAVRKTEIVPVEEVLAAAKDTRLGSVLVVGRELNGTLYVACSHNADKSLALLARATAQIACAEELGLYEGK